MNKDAKYAEGIHKKGSRQRRLPERYERSDLRESIAVCQCVDFLTGLAHGTFLGVAGDIAGNILGGEDAVNGDVVDLVSGGEQGGNTLNGSTIIGGTLQGLSDGLARLHGGDQQQNLFALHHGDQVITENQLAGMIELRSDHIDVFIAVHIETVLVGQMAGKEGTDHLAAVHTDNGVDGIGVGITLCQNHGSLTSHHVLVLDASDINVVAVVRMTSGKMTGESGDHQMGIETGFDMLCVHVLTSSTNWPVPTKF